MDLPAGAPLVITSSGYVQMHASLRAVSQGGRLGTGEFPNGILAVYWGDNRNRAGGQCIATVGAAPSRRWVHEWEDATHSGDSSPTSPVHLTYEVILSEGTNFIDFVYQRMDGARSSTVGIEAPNGTAALQPFGAMGAPTAGRNFRFTPVP